MTSGWRDQGRWGRGAISLALSAAIVLAAIALGAHPPSAAADPPAPQFYGISPAAVEQLTDDEYERMGNANIGTLRVAFYWPHIQPPTQAGEPGGDPAYKWADTDRIVRMAAMNGMEVLPFVYGTPSWTANDPRIPPSRTARAREAWDKLFRALIGRYGPGGEFWTNPDLAPIGVEPKPITAWQIWNEPNSPTFFKQGHGAPSQYARTLDIAAEAIRESDADATIVLAGLFASPKGGQEFSRFLGRLLNVNGVGDDFDAMGVHPYAPTLDKLVERFELARAVMYGHGLSKPIWVTELGWPTGGTKVGNFRKTPNGQANILRNAFDLLLARRDDWGIQRVVWYTWRDNRLLPSCDICSYSGLFKRKGGAKPAWNAFVSYTGGQS